MTGAVQPMPPVMIVLRQVDGPRWCVVRHEIQNGKHVFAGRIATARDYVPACRMALRAAKEARLPLAIQANGTKLRPFSPSHDLPKQGVD